jgi:hypothetical protein
MHWSPEMLFLYWVQPYGPGPTYYERLYETTPQSTLPSIQTQQPKKDGLLKCFLEYDIELYKIDVSGYEDVGSMPKEVFEEEKKCVFYR